jgi:hypothetical protein
MLFLQATARAATFALVSAGKSRLARMAMMAITTSNSIKVNASMACRRDEPRADSKFFNVIDTGTTF